MGHKGDRQVIHSLEGNIAGSRSGKDGCGMGVMNILPFETSYLRSGFTQKVPLRHLKNIFWLPRGTKSFII